MHRNRGRTGLFGLWLSRACLQSLRDFDLRASNVVHGTSSTWPFSWRNGQCGGPLGNARRSTEDSLYEARIFVRGTVKSWRGRIERAMRDDISPCRRSPARGEAMQGEAGRVPRYGSAASCTFHITTRRLMRQSMTEFRKPAPLSSTFKPSGTPRTAVPGHPHL